ncbi:MAG: hypothetical protein WKG00_34245 [Polyangiaceae bacterium]
MRLTGALDAHQQHRAAPRAVERAPDRRPRVVHSHAGARVRVCLGERMRHLFGVERVAEAPLAASQVTLVALRGGRCGQACLATPARAERGDDGHHRRGARPGLHRRHDTPLAAMHSRVGRWPMAIGMVGGPCSTEHTLRCTPGRCGSAGRS